MIGQHTIFEPILQRFGDLLCSLTTTTTPI